MNEWMNERKKEEGNTEHLWNDTDRGQQKYSEKTPTSVTIFLSRNLGGLAWL